MSFCFYEEGVIIIRDKYYFLLISSLFPIVNLLIGILDENFLVNVINSNWMIKEFIRLSFAAVAEELFFRGLLQNELLLWIDRKIVVILGINVLFGLLHFLNVFSYANVSYVLVQVFCAFCVGMTLSAIYLRTRRLIISVIIHSLINVISAFRTCSEVTSTLNTFESIVYVAVACVYLVVALKMIRENDLMEASDEVLY